MADRASVIYWDTSAILSSVFADAHSENARIWAEKEAVHFISTLAFAEFCAVISRMQRERILTEIMAGAVLEVLNGGPWRIIFSNPDLEIVKDLSAKWPLRGADLWHLATAKSLQTDFPELLLLSFDSRLNQAAEGELLIEKGNR
jgi:predicted nucleic acid-binding protein